MKQEQAAGKVLVELIGTGTLDEKHEFITYSYEEHELIVYNYLMQVYAVGYDTGTKARSNKKQIAQLTLERKLIDIFESAAEASRRTKVQHSDISKCAIGKLNHAGGYLWEYIDTKNPISCETETIKSYRPKSTPPK